MKRYRSGDFNQLVTVERQEKEQRSDGTTKIVFRPYKKIWAQANGLYGKEFWTAKEYGAEETVEFVIRYLSCPDISTKDRIVFRGLIYNIIHPDNIMFSNDFIRIKAVAETWEI